MGHISLMTLDTLMKCTFSYEGNIQTDRSVIILQGFCFYQLYALTPCMQTMEKFQTRAMLIQPQTPDPTQGEAWLGIFLIND